MDLRKSLFAVAVFSQTVGSVEDSVFTSRQVFLSAVVVKAARAQKLDDVQSLKIGNGEVATLLLDEALAREARSFGLAQVEKAEVEKVVQVCTKALVSKDVQKKFEFTPQEMSETVERRLVAMKMIDLRSE